MQIEPITVPREWQKSPLVRLIFGPTLYEEFAALFNATRTAAEEVSKLILIDGVDAEQLDDDFRRARLHEAGLKDPKRELCAITVRTIDALIEARGIIAKPTVFEHYPHLRKRQRRLGDRLERFRTKLADLIAEREWAAAFRRRA